MFLSTKQPLNMLFKIKSEHPSEHPVQKKLIPYYFTMLFFFRFTHYGFDYNSNYS